LITIEVIEIEQQKTIFQILFFLIFPLANKQPIQYQLLLQYLLAH